MSTHDMTIRRAALSNKVREILSLEVPPGLDDELAKSELWDSMAVVLVVAAIDDLAEPGSEPVDGQAVSRCATLRQILELAGCAP